MDPDEAIVDRSDQYAAWIRDEAWVDVVGCPGDGFDATYTVAHLVSQPGLAVDEHYLPRGESLVLIGDLVKLPASPQTYRERMVGPYTVALPAGDEERDHVVLAVPGPADWKDGLRTFRQTFTKRGRLGSRRTVQPASYFLARLPGRWWLLGLDPDEDGLLDPDQLEYLRFVADELGHGDGIVVVARDTPGMFNRSDTSWLLRVGADLNTLIDDIIAPTGAEIRMVIVAADHVYARYEAPDSGYQFVNCGGGGAYTTSTGRYVHGAEHGSSRVVRRLLYPARIGLRPFLRGAFVRLPLRNPAYLVLLAVLHAAFMLTVVPPPTSSSPTVFTIVAVTLAAVLAPGRFGSPSDLLQRAASLGVPVKDSRLGFRVLVALHVLGQIGPGLALSTLWALPTARASGIWPLVWAFVLYAPVAGRAASQLSAVYLVISSFLTPVNRELLHAASGVQSHKSFLRLHVTGDLLTVYALGVDTVCSEWVASRDAPPGSSLLEPAHPVGVHLIEAVRIPRVP